MRRVIVIYLLCLPMIAGLMGCGSRLFTFRDTNPVLEDYLGTWPSREIGTLATRAGHRVNMARMADGAPVEKERWQRGEFCMEPPPDTMETVAAAFTAKILVEGKGTDPKTSSTAEGKTEGELARNMATAMAPLLRRTQGLQWTRDNLSFVCASYINRRITSEQYEKLFERIITESVKLISAEIPYLPTLPTALNSPTLPALPAKAADPAKPAPPPPPAPTATSTKPGALETGVPVLGSPSSLLEQRRQTSEPKSAVSTAKSFFQRLWNWD